MHLGPHVAYICINELQYQRLKMASRLFGTESLSDQWWLINRAPGNKFKWYLNQNAPFFIKKIIWKCSLQNCHHFVSGIMTKWINTSQRNTVGSGSWFKAFQINWGIFLDCDIAFALITWYPYGQLCFMYTWLIYVNKSQWTSYPEQLFCYINKKNLHHNMIVSIYTAGKMLTKA